ncbi:MAG: ATP-binding protein [Bacteroidota bacterium]
MSLKTRMFIYILSTSIVIFSAGIGYISLRYKNKAMYDAKIIANAYAREYANIIKSEMDKDFGFARGVAQAALAVEDEFGKEGEHLQFEILKNFIKNNPSYIASFLQWDLSDCDTSYNKTHGRRRYLCNRKNPLKAIKGLLSKEEYLLVDTMKGLVDTVDYNPENPYYIVKNTKKEYIIDPYFYSYDDVTEMPSEIRESEEAILETTIIVPIVSGNKFRAITGVDIPLNHFMKTINKIKPFEDSYAFIVSNNGAFVAHPDIKNLAKAITDIYCFKKEDLNIVQKIKVGKEFSFTIADSFGRERYFMLSPIIIGKTDMPWSMGISVPVDIVMVDANRHFYISIGVGVFGLIILSIIIWIIANTITSPIKATTELLKKLAKGKIDSSEKIEINTNDEIADMANSANILIDGLNHTAAYAKKIGEGNLEVHYQLLSNDDTLGYSLIEMRDKLKQSKEEIEIKNRELEKLSMVVQNTDNAVMIMDKTGYVEWVNKAFVKMYGYTKDDVINQLGGNLLKQSAHPKILELIDESIKENKSVFYESSINAKSGDEILALTTLTPIKDANGKLVRLIAIDSDITSIKKAKEEIESQRDKMETQRDELQLMNATKDKFFSILAHDLKNPFSGLYSLSEILNNNYESTEEEDKKEIISKIYVTAKQIYSLLENLLTWSQSQRGLIQFEPFSQDLHNIINTNINLHKTAAENKNINLITEVDDELKVFCDRNMINTVVRNLLNNAVKFTPSDGEIIIRAEKNNNYVQVSIIDNGIGISKDDQLKLFRIDIKTKSIGSSKEKGSGLGLILCKELIEKNGGKIRVESDLGKGSSFVFTIPVN